MKKRAKKKTSSKRGKDTPTPEAEAHDAKLVKASGADGTRSQGGLVVEGASRKSANPLGGDDRGGNPGVEFAGRGGVPSLGTPSRKNTQEIEQTGTGAEFENKAADDVPVTPEEVERKQDSGGHAGFPALLGEVVGESEEGGRNGTGEGLTTKQADTAASDLVLREGGFSVVDQLDAEDYARIRDAKRETLEQLVERLQWYKDNHNDNPLLQLKPSVLALIGQKLGQMEKDKLSVIQLKVGKPSERPAGKYKFRARIGVQAKGAETDTTPGPAPEKTAAAAAVEVEIESDGLTDVNVQEAS